jgi:hypothetical protein
MTSFDVSGGNKHPLRRRFSVVRRDGKTQSREFLCFTAFTTKREAMAFAKEQKEFGLKARIISSTTKATYFVYLYGEM